MIDIKPVGGYIPYELDKVIERELEKEIKKTLADFQTATSTWRNQPDFQIETGKERAAVFTDDEIFGYVDEGTRPHEIKPRYAKALRFNASFVPKTVPNRLKAGAGGSGPPVVYSQGVQHPGNKPRNITKIIADRSQRRFVKAVDGAIIRLRNIGK